MTLAALIFFFFFGGAACCIRNLPRKKISNLKSEISELKSQIQTTNFPYKPQTATTKPVKRQGLSRRARRTLRCTECGLKNARVGSTAAEVALASFANFRQRRIRIPLQIG